MKPRIKVTINGQVCTGRAGQTLLEIAEHNGIAIPNLCHNGGTQALRRLRPLRGGGRGRPKLCGPAPPRPRTAR